VEGLGLMVATVSSTGPLARAGGSRAWRDREAGPVATRTRRPSRGGTGPRDSVTGPRVLPRMLELRRQHAVSTDSGFGRDRWYGGAITDCGRAGEISD
jgi:hypothetical protein